MSKAWSVFVSTLIIFVFAHFWVGIIYWWWMAYDLGSWWMWGLSLFPPFTVVAVVTAVWSFYIGVPAWVIGTFGS